MKLAFWIAGLAAGLILSGLGLARAQTAPAPTRPYLDIRHFAGVLHVIPEARSDIAVTITPGKTFPKPSVTRDGARVVIDGGMGGRIISCSDSFGLWGSQGWRFFVIGRGIVHEASMPVITARVPLDVMAAVGGAVKTDIGPSHSAGLSFAGCGDTNIGAVAGGLNLKRAGSGDTRLNGARAIVFKAHGSGDLYAPESVGAATLSKFGSGDVTLGGALTRLDLVSRGSGDFRADTVNGPTAITLVGSGDARVGQINGSVSTRVRGSADVTIGRGDVSAVDIDVRGSGDVRVGASVGGGRVKVAGSGDVGLSHASGVIEQVQSGSGSISIGR